MRMSVVIHVPIWGGAVLLFICFMFCIICFSFWVLFFTSFYSILFDHVSFHFAPFDFMLPFLFYPLLLTVFIYAI